MLNQLKLLWRNVRQNVRQLSGEDAYERYLQHYAAVHTQADVAPPLSREAYFKQWQDAKWQGIKRCC